MKKNKNEKNDHAYNHASAGFTMDYIGMTAKDVSDKYKNIGIANAAEELKCRLKASARIWLEVLFVSLPAALYASRKYKNNLTLQFLCLNNSLLLTLLFWTREKS